jgi:hypothetical protein
MQGQEGGKHRPSRLWTSTMRRCVGPFVARFVAGRLVPFCVLLLCVCGGVSSPPTKSHFFLSFLTKQPQNKTKQHHSNNNNNNRTRETAQFIAQREMVLRDAVDPTLEYNWTSMRPRVRLFFRQSTINCLTLRKKAVCSVSFVCFCLVCVFPGDVWWWVWWCCGPHAGVQLDVQAPAGQRMYIHKTV